MIYDEYGKQTEQANLKWGQLFYADETAVREQTLSKFFCPHPAQADVLASNARFIAAIGGVNGGKSSVGALWLAQRIAENPKGQYLVCAPTFKIVKSGTLEAWRKVVDGSALHGHYRGGQEPEYICGAGGARVYFRSLDNPKSCEGLKPLAVWFDEAGLCPIESFNAIRGRIAGTNGRCILTTTPYLEYNWLLKEIIDKAKNGDPNYCYRSFPSLANPEQDEDVIAEEKRAMPEWLFRLRYLGEWTKPAGCVYPDFDSCVVDVSECPPFKKAEAIYGSIDHGGADPTAALVGFLDKHNTLWIFFERYVKSREEDILKTVDALVEWNGKLSRASKKTVQRWYADHRPDVNRALKRKGLSVRPASKGSNSIAIGIALVQARIRRTMQGLTGGLKIVRQACPNLITESGLYRYPLAEGEACGTTPVDRDNHALDCLRYLILGIDRKSQKTIAA